MTRALVSSSLKPQRRLASGCSDVMIATPQRVAVTTPNFLKRMPTTLVPQGCRVTCLVSDPCRNGQDLRLADQRLEMEAASVLSQWLFGGCFALCSEFFSLLHFRG
jgi:hypothetical protein